MAESKDFPDSFYRVAVKGLCVREGKLLLSHDFVNPNKPVWELPGGGLDFGENFKEALVREVKEEMGLEVTSIADTPTYAWTAKIENARGMDWYYVLILGFAMEVSSLDITPTDECRSIRFFSKEELGTLLNLNTQLEPLRTLFNPADFA